MKETSNINKSLGIFCGFLSKPSQSFPSSIWFFLLKQFVWEMSFRHCRTQKPRSLTSIIVTVN
jgi:hypothetical protein